MQIQRLAPIDPAAFMRAHKEQRRVIQRSGDRDALKAYEAAGIENWLYDLRFDGTLAATYTDEGCWTGRLIASGVAIQSMPRLYRAAVSQPGRVVMEADWHAMHPWILAMASGDAGMLALLTSGDIYAAIANQSTDIKRTAGHGPEARKLAKLALLGWLNGQGEKARRDMGAGDLDASLRTLFPTAHAYLEGLKKTGRCVYPGGVWEAPMVKPDGSKVEPHTRPAGFLQGLESDALKLALGQLPPVTVLMHDAVVLLVSESDAPQHAEYVREVMAQSLLDVVYGSGVQKADPALQVSMVEVKAGPTWGSASADQTTWKAAPARPVSLYEWAVYGNTQCVDRRMTLSKDGFFPEDLVFGVVQWRAQDPEAYLRWRRSIDTDGTALDKKLAKLLHDEVSPIVGALASWQRRNDPELLPDHSDVAVTGWLLARHAAVWRIHPEGTLYVLNEESLLWEADEVGCVLPAALVGVHGRENFAGEKYELQAGHVGALVEQIKTQLFSTGKVWRRGASTRVAFADCVWTPEGTRERRASDMLTEADVVDANYRDAFDANGERIEPTRFLAWVTERWDGIEDADRQLIHMQEFLGLSRLGMASQHQRHLIFTGHGATGKSTLIDVVERALFAPAAISRVSFKDAQDPKERIGLWGSLINVCSDAPAADLEESADIKAILAGEGVTMRKLYKQAVNANPAAGWIVAANSLPRVSSGSPFWRRFDIFDFPNVVPEEQRRDGIRNELLQERALIAAWALEGARTVIRNGKYTWSSNDFAHSRDLRTDVERIGNPLMMWMEECCETVDDKKDWCKATDMYSSYEEWCKANRHTALSTTAFGVRLKETRGVMYQRRANGGFYNRRVRDAAPVLATPPRTFFSRNTDVN